jgi:hypothetical protein
MAHPFPHHFSLKSKYTLLTLFLVEHTNALDRAVITYQLAETPSTGRSNRLGGGLTALDRRDVESLDSLLREGPRREQCAWGCSEIDRPLRTPSTAVETKEESKGGWKS